MEENATLRARLAELEDKCANRPSGRAGLPETGIAERKRIEDALKASEIRYRRLFETAKDGILILDADTGRITDANPFLQKFLGYSRAELLGKMLWEIGPFRDIAASRGAFRRLQRKEYIRYDNLPLETKGRRRRHVEFVSNVYQENGARVIQCNIRDITARHQAEEALANVNRELEKRVEERTAELLTANKLMKKMLDEGKRSEEKISKSRERLRNLSGRLQSLLEEERTRISREIHDELGQSLTALKLELSSIRRSLVSDGLAERSAKVHETERTVSRIIRTVQKIATDLRPGILDELGVAAAIEWVAKDFQNRTGIRCKVAIQAADKLSDTVRATAIFRIVQEALTNVMRHAAASQVTVNLERKDDTLIVRGERQRNRDQGRTDFRRQVAWPHRDPGTRPAARRRSRNQRETGRGDPGKSDSSHWKKGRTRMLRILVADDHEVVRKGLVKVLAESLQPVKIDEARNGQEAMSKVRKSEYDLVVLDIKMPGKSGLDVLKEIKQHQPKLPVMILSMHPEEQFAIRAMRAGASGYLTKECAGDELVLAIRKALKGERYISGSLAEILAGELDSDSEKPLHEILSDREYQVMLMIASGKPVGAIAKELCLSVKTISSYRANILLKTRMKNNAEITHYAIQNKLVD